MTRRHFLAGAAAASTAAAATPPEPLLGLDDSGLRGSCWDAFQKIELAAQMALDVARFSDRELIHDADYLRQVQAYAAERNIRLETGIRAARPGYPSVGKDRDRLLTAIGVARSLGATTVCFAIGEHDLRREGGPLERHLENAIRTFRAVREEALRAGVTLAPTNLSGLRASELRAVIEAAGADFIGAAIDTGAPLEALEDPLEAVETLAPVAVGLNVRDFAIWPDERGAAYRQTPLGDGTIGIQNVVRRFVELRPDAPILLETAAGGGAARTLAYFENDFWAAFPHLQAEEFLRFARLVARGKPFDAETSAANEGAELWRGNLEQDLNFLRKSLSTG